MNGSRSAYKSKNYPRFASFNNESAYETPIQKPSQQRQEQAWGFHGRDYQEVQIMRCY